MYIHIYIYIAGGSCGHWAGDQHGRELEQLLPRHNRQGTHFTCFTGTKLQIVTQIEPQAVFNYDFGSVDKLSPVVEAALGLSYI